MPVARDGHLGHWPFCSLRDGKSLSWENLPARLEGLEPPAGCLEGSCSIRLSYRRLRAHCA